jgi:enterochelin esterase family protein
MTIEDTPVGPRLLTLQRELGTSPVDALAAFWQEVSQKGTPLIEPIEGESKYVLVTFICKAPSNAENVSVRGPLSGQGYISEPMTCLLDTDLWYKTYRIRNDIRTDYRIVLDGVEQPDDLNPHQQIFPADEEGFSDKETKVSVLELPAAPPQVWINRRLDVMSGKVEHHRLYSNILDNERRIWIYTPAGYTLANEPYHLLVLFDRWMYSDVIPIPIILDNLIASGSVPPLIAIMIGSVNMETRFRELSCNSSFIDFVAQELIPWAHQHYHVTNDPSRTIVSGASLGGLAAAYAGLRCSEIFGKILSQSGSFWWKPEDDIEYEWLTKQFVASPRLHLSFYLEVGLLETGEEPSQLDATRRLRDVLQVKGYRVYYSEYSGGHNPVCWQGSLADGLMLLLGNDRIT